MKDATMEGVMTRWLRSPIRSSFLIVASLATALLPVPASAQVFGDVISTSLNRNCSALGVPFGVSATTVQGLGFGANLATLCASGVAAASTSGPQLTTGALPDQTRFGLTDEQRRRQRRLPDPEGSASADEEIPLRLSVYTTGEYENFDKDVTRFEPGYQSDSYGGVIGADYAVTNWLVAGVALKYSNTRGRFFQRGGSFETDAYSALLYLSTHPTANLFVDIVGGYTRKDYQIDRRINFSIDRPVDGISLVRIGSAIGATDGDEWRASTSAGYDFSVGRVTVGPRLGVHYRHTTIEGFREHGRRSIGCIQQFAGPTTCTGLTGTGLELDFDRQTDQSLQTTAGVFAALPVSLGFGVLVPQITVEHVHEFLRDQRTIRFRFAEDNAFRTKFRFQNDPPDRDYINASGGLVLVLPNRIAPFVNYQGLFGYSDQHRHTVTAGVRIEF